MMSKLPKIIFTLSLISLILSIGARIYVVNALSTEGDQVVALESQISQLSEENEGLMLSIALESSLTKVKERALAIGMSKDTKLEFLSPSLSAQANAEIKM